MKEVKEEDTPQEDIIESLSDVFVDSDTSEDKPKTDEIKE